MQRMSGYWLWPPIFQRTDSGTHSIEHGCCCKNSLNQHLGFGWIKTALLNSDGLVKSPTSALCCISQSFNVRKVRLMITNFAMPFYPAYVWRGNLNFLRIHQIVTERKLSFSPTSVPAPGSENRTGVVEIFVLKISAFSNIILIECRDGHYLSAFFYKVKNVG